MLSQGLGHEPELPVVNECLGPGHTRSDSYHSHHSKASDYSSLHTHSRQSSIEDHRTLHQRYKPDRFYVDNKFVTQSEKTIVFFFFSFGAVFFSCTFFWVKIKHICLSDFQPGYCLLKDVINILSLAAQACNASFGLHCIQI